MSTAYTDEPSALDLMDEAIRILRAIPASAWSAYCVGAVPFWSGVLLYWTLLVHGGMASQLGSATSVLLAGLYVWKRVWHMRFGSRLQAFIRAQPPPRWGVRDWIAAAGIQARWSCPSLALSPLSAVTLLPTFFHLFGHETLAVGALRPSEERTSLPRRAMQWATAWTGQIHVAGVLLSGIAAVLWLNVAVLLAVAPWMVEWLTGWRPAFAPDLLWVMHPTFAAVVTVLTFVALDPLLKAFTALRVHRLEARISGEDLRIEWQRVRRRLPTLATVLVLWLSTTAFVRAAEPARPTLSTPNAEFAERLDSAIQYVFQQPHIVWRLQPPASKTSHSSWLRTWLRKAADWLENQWRRFTRWLRRMFGPTASARAATYSVSDWARRVAFALIPILGLVALGWLVRLWRARRERPRSDLNEPAISVDRGLLDPERSQATDQPAETWWRLAQQLAAMHDYRRAIRAAFLAVLAEAAARSWVDIAPARTNRDYIAQLRRRFRDGAVVQRFQEAVRVFESCWYGAHPATPEAFASLRQLGELLRATIPA